jgi:hypothetical protein
MHRQLAAMVWVLLLAYSNPHFFSSSETRAYDRCLAIKHHGMSTYILCLVANFAYLAMPIVIYWYWSHYDKYVIVGGEIKITYLLTYLNDSKALFMAQKIYVRGSQQKVAKC